MAKHAHYACLVNPEGVGDRMFSAEGSSHLEHFRKRGWISPEELTKETVRKLAKAIGLEPGPAAKQATMAAACIQAMLP